MQTAAVRYRFSPKTMLIVSSVFDVACDIAQRIRAKRRDEYKARTEHERSTNIVYNFCDFNSSTKSNEYKKLTREKKTFEFMHGLHEQHSIEIGRATRHRCIQYIRTFAPITMHANTDFVRWHAFSGWYVL